MQVARENYFPESYGFSATTCVFEETFNTLK